MKLLFSNNWLRQRIATDPDREPEAGRSLEHGDADMTAALTQQQRETLVVLAETNSEPLRVGFGAVVRQLRTKRGLTRAQLAEKAAVSENELREVEENPSYTARPRFLFQISGFFRLSLESLSQMSGATQVVDRSLYDTTVKFAAYSGSTFVSAGEDNELLKSLVDAVVKREEPVS
jgi:transcriptional regulator with XRE-family HTH domain